MPRPAMEIHPVKRPDGIASTELEEPASRMDIGATKAGERHPNQRHHCEKLVPPS